MRPLLAFCSDGNEKNVRDAIEALAQQLGLTDEERLTPLRSGSQTVFSNRVYWAQVYLVKAAALERTRRSHFRITARGKQLLEQNPTRIDNTVLRQFAEFLAFQRPRDAGPAAPEEIAATNVDVIDARTTPEELIQEAEAEISEDLQAQLLDRIAQQSPAFFERLVVDLLVAMGYGGSRGRVVQRLGRPGDEGIDGVINEDALGLGVVYVQAKRYAAANTIGREQIQQFAGALVGKGATKGVFVTTSAFSRGAVDYPRTIPHLRIVLIDGQELAKLMVQYNVGVRIERTVEVKKIDLDYFEPDE